jgi:uncharacterized NAD(P)/FAD-binding protein YdhS
MRPEQKKDFAMRLEAETHFKTALRQFKKQDASKQDNEYSASNYYGQFLKDQIKLLQQSASATKTKVNAQLIRDLYWKTWL